MVDSKRDEMDVRKIINSPELVLKALGISEADAKADEVVDLVDKVAVAKKQIKETKKRKGEISSGFKQVAVESGEYAALVAEMQDVSKLLRDQEEQYKAIEKQLIDLIKQPKPVKSVNPPLLQIKEESNYHGYYEIRELPVKEWHRWFTYVESKCTSAYHQKPWSSLIQQSFGHLTRIWVVEAKDGAILGGIPLVFFNSRLFGRFAVSIPYFNYGGVVSDWINVAKDLLAHLRTVSIEERLSYVEVRSMQADLADRVSTKKVSMILDLPATEGELDENVGAKVRAQYRKAEEHSPQICFGKAELLEDFYKVFARNMRDLGTPVYSKQWFANILANKEIQAWIAIVFIKGRPVSCGFMIGYRDMLEIPWASTVKGANHTNANMWLYRNILGFAIRNGYRFFDFGRSTRDAGTYKFKKQWGAKPYPHYWYYLSADEQGYSELNPDNPKYKLMIATWKLLPVWFTKILGPLIVRDIA